MLGFSVYLDKDLTADDHNYLLGMRNAGFNEVFTSLTGLNDEAETILKRLNQLTSWCKDLELKVMADVSQDDLHYLGYDLADVEKLNVPNEVMVYIATKIKSNIRELEGALTRVVAYSSLINKDISYDLAVEALKDIVTTSESQEISVNRIKEKVSTTFGIKMDDFNSKKRTRAIAYPRQIAMYLSRELTDLSLPKIGNEFGGRDHTTVIHAHDKISKDLELEKNSELKEKIDKIIVELKG